MRLILAENQGFCFGVRRAMDMVQSAASGDRPVYTIGELIHNPSVIASLEEKGVRAVDGVSDIPDGAIAVIRSHGVPPHVYRECAARGLKLIDATCPFVARTHDIVADTHAEGRRIVIVGDSRHPECIGINGFCGDSALFIGSEDDIALLAGMDHICMVSQTTASLSLFEAASVYAYANCNDVKICNTICNTTSTRQEEAESLAKKCTKMVVIGARTSSNTRKLADVCKKYCNNVQSLEKPGELILEKINADDIIGIVQAHPRRIG